MNPFLGDSNKSAMAIIMKNAEPGSKSEYKAPNEENPIEAAMVGLMKSMAQKDVKKAVMAFKALIELVDMSEDTEEDDNQMEF